MDRKTIGAAFDRSAHGAGDHEAVVFTDLDLRWTYRTLHEHTVQLAKGLIALGVDSGDHVAVWATNRPEWVLLQLATAKIGAVLVSVDPACRADELAYVLEQADVTALFTIEHSTASDHLAKLREICPEFGRSSPTRLTSRRFPHLKRVALIDANSAPEALGWMDLLRGGAGMSDHILRRREDAVDPHDTALVQYTSETTDAPKGAQLSHLNLLGNAAGVGACLRLTDRDRVCVPVPFHRSVGSMLGTLTSLAHGATVVVPGEQFDAGQTLIALAQERCTVWHGLPSMFVAALDHPRFATFDLSSLRAGVLADAPTSHDVTRRIVERMRACKIAIAYGHIETSPVITLTRTEDPISLRVSTVGRPLPGVQVKIVDDAGRETPRGTEGELCCRGSLVMRGYYKMPEATADVLDRSGWLHTGDLATMDEHGYCRITGRSNRTRVEDGKGA